MSKSYPIAPLTDDNEIESVSDPTPVEEADEVILQPYDVAYYFVNASRYVLDIAREFDISISEVYQLAETESWRRCLEICGYTGENIKTPPPACKNATAGGTTHAERTVLNRDRFSTR